MNLTCLSSSDPAAENYILVFDFNSDDENLCKREDLQAPLPVCSSSAFPPHSRCLVCRSDGLVYTFIRNLERGVKVMMEALNQVQVEISECSKPLDISEVGQNRTFEGYIEGNTPSADPPHQLSGSVVFIIVLGVLMVIGLIICVVYKLWRRRRQRKQRQRVAAVDPIEEEAVAEAAV